MLPVQVLVVDLLWGLVAVVGAELADALGMARKWVDRQLNRARAETVEALAALVVARTGRGNCPQLAQQLDTLLNAEQQRAGHRLILNPKQSKAIGAHTSTCPICSPQAQDARTYSKWALPPVLPLTEDDEERRRTALAFLSRTNSSPTTTTTTTTSSAAVLPAASSGAAVADKTATTAGLLDRIRSTIVSALTRMPGANTVMQLAQQDPELFRRIVGAAAGLGVIIVAAAAWFAIDAARNDPPTPPRP